MSFSAPPSASYYAPATALRAPSETDGDVLSQIDLASSAFFFDVDGTLIDIAPHPDAVEVPAPLVSHLRTLSELTGGAVALVSGREAAVLDALFAPLHLPVSGIHGAQMRRTPDAPIDEISGALDPAVRDALRGLTRSFDKLHVEDKGASVALHYRATPAIQPELEEAIARIVGPHSRTLTVLPGRMVFEVKNRGHDKGAAVRSFMSRPPFAGRMPLFFGDDVTDEAGFAAVRELGGLAVSIGRRLPGADAVLEDAEAVRELVRRLVQTEGRD